MGVQSNKPPTRKSYDPAAVYDPSSRRRYSPTKAAPLPTRFPDEDHVYQPLRRLHAAKLQQNSLPPPSPASSRWTASPRVTPKKRQRIANIADSQLWGFSVKYSPSQELSDHWKRAKEHETTEAERLRDEETEKRHRLQSDQLQAQLSAQDYSLYLYLASKYGALDAILYCSTPFPGRLYALLIDQSVRKLQKWRHDRLIALRRYWIVTLARDVVDKSLRGGFAQIQLAMEHQRKATMFLKRLRWRFVASAFRSWFEFTQRQAEVRWRFQFSLQESLRSRFVQWRERVAHVKQFKQQLKQVARRKRMQAAMVQWLEWQNKHQRLRVHLQQQWTKLQRVCFVGWTTYTHLSKSQRLAAIRIQSQWRASRQRRQYVRMKHGATTIARLARGFLARRFVAELRLRVDTAHTLEKILRTIEWEAICVDLTQARTVAVDQTLARAERLARICAEAATQAMQFVTTELEKVRKTATHQQLQAKVRWLEEEGGVVGHDVDTDRGLRTQEVLVQRATQMLLEEAAAAARQHAPAEFLRHPDTQFCLPYTDDTQCVVCVSSASVLAALAVPWIPHIQPCSHAHLIRDREATDVDGLRQEYSKIMEEMASRDAAIQRRLSMETTQIPPHELRKGLTTMKTVRDDQKRRPPPEVPFLDC